MLALEAKTICEMVFGSLKPILSTRGSTTVAVSPRSSFRVVLLFIISSKSLHQKGREEERTYMTAVEIRMPYKMATSNTITHGDLEHLDGRLPYLVVPLFCSPMKL